MDARLSRRVVGTFCVAALFATAAAASTGFTSIDQRLPNPDRPYEMTSGTVNFIAPPFFGLYDLEFKPTNPAQLDVPVPTPSGKLVFDSEFDISYRAMVSFGLGPVHQVSGVGTAHAVGTAPAGTNPQFFDTELLALNLYGLSPIPEVYFRESPTLQSKGKTIREDLCPLCLAPVTYWRVTSVFDVYGEFSYNGGTSWTPGDTSFRIEQAPRPLLPGDFNENSIVDAADYVVWRDGLGTTYAQDDYEVWRANFGMSIGNGTALSSVPEPATLLLLTFAGFATMTLRCRKQIAQDNV